jgi:hypothetical protein
VITSNPYLSVKITKKPFLLLFCTFRSSAKGRFSIVRRRLFDMLLHIKGLDFVKVKKYCEDFHLNERIVLLEQR